MVSSTPVVVEPGVGEAGFGGDDFGGGLGLDAEVVDRAGGTGALEQHELERWVLDREVRVAGLGLGRLGTEHLAVELDRLIEVVDVEGELQTHGWTPVVDGSSVAERHVSTVIDMLAEHESTSVNMFSWMHSTSHPNPSCAVRRCCGGARRGTGAELAEVLKALADPVRLRLVSIIGTAETGEVCACDLPALVDRTQPTVSHHLSLLVKAGVLEREQRGKWAWFRLRRERLAALSDAW
jgi:ArsR family transcriptional regulator, arsenate/arsenite/antimonite-responsive transcriptional repressor